MVDVEREGLRAIFSRVNCGVQERSIVLTCLWRFFDHRVVFNTLEGFLVHLELAELSLRALLGLSCLLGVVEGVDGPENGQFSSCWFEGTQELGLTLGSRE